MVDQDTADYVRALQHRRGDRSLAATLRYLLDEGIAADRRHANSRAKAA